MFRVGFGQDSHRFSLTKNKKLFLGGIEVENEIGLKGNSDGDVAIHALCRAIEQALGNPDFSNYSDKMCKNGITDSKEYLKVALLHIQEKKYSISNVGISFECQSPKIAPLAEKMKRVLSEILEINISQIGINASTGEDLSAFGKGKGIQCFAIISLIKCDAKNQD